MEKIKEKISKAVQFLLNPHLVLCLGVAWMITNGWSYVGAALGAAFKWKWLTAVSSAYLTMLWFPFTPEKLITAAIAIWLLKKLFPDDQKTLKVLEDFKESVREKHLQAVQRRKARREEKAAEKSKGKTEISRKADNVTS